MFKKIVIANRCQIASRIIKTARRMGMGTAAVYSPADQNGPHEPVRMRSKWRIGEKVCSGTINGRLIAVAARPIINGFAMLEHEDATDRKALLCPMPGFPVAAPIMTFA